MKLLFHIFCILLCVSSGYAFQLTGSGIITSSSLYYIGYKSETEQTSFNDPSATWQSFTSTSGSRVYLRALTIPAGATVKRIKIYFGANVESSGVTAGVWAYSSSTAAGAALATSTITPSANSWVFSGDLSGTQTSFQSSTNVYIGYAVNTPTRFTISYDSSPAGTDDYKYNTSITYPFSSGGSLANFTDRDLPVVLEYSK